MKRWLIVLLIILGVFLIVGFSLYSTIVGKYNQLVTLSETVDAAWSQVENQYQRRADLIPNLVETVKAYAEKEESIFTQIADARARIGSSQTRVQREQTESELTGFLSRLLMLQENYPQLKSNQNFLDLQAQLEGTENRISVERQRYIQSIKDYNMQVKQFPGRLIAGFFGFEARDFYQATPGAETAPRVDFGGGPPQE
ncbi:MAG: LemA family protein [Candidatus Omnitrophica bacterium]|nr:LemA family protein [Candidatus Omnitrophota bacterium]